MAKFDIVSDVPAADLFDTTYSDTSTGLKGYRNPEFNYTVYAVDPSYKPNESKDPEQRAKDAADASEKAKQMYIDKLHSQLKTITQMYNITDDPGTKLGLEPLIESLKSQIEQRSAAPAKPMTNLDDVELAYNSFIQNNNLSGKSDTEIRNSLANNPIMLEQYEYHANRKKDLDTFNTRLTDLKKKTDNEYNMLVDEVLKGQPEDKQQSIRKMLEDGKEEAIDFIKTNYPNLSSQYSTLKKTYSDIANRRVPLGSFSSRLIAPDFREKISGITGVPYNRNDIMYTIGVPDINDYIVVNKNNSKNDDFKNTLPFKGYRHYSANADKIGTQLDMFDVRSNNAEEKLNKQRDTSRGIRPDEDEVIKSLEELRADPEASKFLQIPDTYDAQLKARKDAVKSANWYSDLYNLIKAFTEYDKNIQKNKFVTQQLLEQYLPELSEYLPEDIVANIQNGKIASLDLNDLAAKYNLPDTLLDDLELLANTQSKQSDKKAILSENFIKKLRGIAGTFKTARNKDTYASMLDEISDLEDQIDKYENGIGSNELEAEQAAILKSLSDIYGRDATNLNEIPPDSKLVPAYEDRLINNRQRALDDLNAAVTLKNDPGTPADMRPTDDEINNLVKAYFNIDQELADAQLGVTGNNLLAKKAEIDKKLDFYRKPDERNRLNSLLSRALNNFSNSLAQFVYTDELGKPLTDKKGDKALLNAVTNKYNETRKAANEAINTERTARNNILFDYNLKAGNKDFINQELPQIHKRHNELYNSIATLTNILARSRENNDTAKKLYEHGYDDRTINSIYPVYQNKDFDTPEGVIKAIALGPDKRYNRFSKNIRFSPQQFTAISDALTQLQNEFEPISRRYTQLRTGVLSDDATAAEENAELLASHYNNAQKAYDAAILSGDQSRIKQANDALDASYAEFVEAKLKSAALNAQKATAIKEAREAGKQIASDLYIRIPGIPGLVPYGLLGAGIMPLLRSKLNEQELLTRKSRDPKKHAAAVQARNKYGTFYSYNKDTGMASAVPDDMVYDDMRKTTSDSLYLAGRPRLGGWASIRNAIIPDYDVYTDVSKGIDRRVKDLVNALYTGDASKFYSGNTFDFANMNAPFFSELGPDAYDLWNDVNPETGDIGLWFNADETPMLGSASLNVTETLDPRTGSFKQSSIGSTSRQSPARAIAAMLMDPNRPASIIQAKNLPFNFYNWPEPLRKALLLRRLTEGSGDASILNTDVVSFLPDYLQTRLYNKYGANAIDNDTLRFSDLDSTERHAINNVKNEYLPNLTQSILPLESYATGKANKERDLDIEEIIKENNLPDKLAKELRKKQNAKIIRKRNRLPQDFIDSLSRIVSGASFKNEAQNAVNTMQEQFGSGKMYSNRSLKGSSITDEAIDEALATGKLPATESATRKFTKEATAREARKADEAANEAATEATNNVKAKHVLNDSLRAMFKTLTSPLTPEDAKLSEIEGKPTLLTQDPEVNNVLTELVSVAPYYAPLLEPKNDDSFKEAVRRLKEDVNNLRDTGKDSAINKVLQEAVTAPSDDKELFSKTGIKVIQALIDQILERRNLLKEHGDRVAADKAERKQMLDELKQGNLNINIVDALKDKR